MRQFSTNIRNNSLSVIQMTIEKAVKLLKNVEIRRFWSKDK